MGKFVKKLIFDDLKGDDGGVMEKKFIKFFVCLMKNKSFTGWIKKRRGKIFAVRLKLMFVIE